MALIKCPECGKEISNRAVSCIYCGFPLSELDSSVSSQDIQTSSETSDDKQYPRERYQILKIEKAKYLNREQIKITVSKLGHLRQVNETALLKMHLQNAYQRVQSTVSEHDGFAIVVADDLNDKTKVLKEAIYDMTLAGDYVQYTNIKKGMYIDFSNQCPGLQIADICAGIFTASAKYERASEKEKHKYECGHELFFDYAYKKTRCCFYNADYDIYKFGVKEVPNGAGTAIAKTLAADIANKLSSDLWVEIHKADVE